MHTREKGAVRGARPALLILLLSMALVILAISLNGRDEAVSASSAGPESTPDAVDALLAELAGRVTPEMDAGECGSEEAAELRLLARERPEQARQLSFMANNVEIYALDVVKTALQSADKLDFALLVPFRGPDESGLDAVLELTPGEIPYLSQYDPRWGYHGYGSGVLGITGCGPTCLAMCAAGLLGDASVNPARVADWAEAAGLYVPGSGSSWELFTAGAAQFGLASRELPLDEALIRSALAEGCAVVASMLPGDFTASGHFVVICGADEGGFILHDPNSRPLSEKTWSYGRLSGQIANLWALSAP